MSVVKPEAPTPRCAARIVTKSGSIRALQVIEDDACPSAGRHRRAGKALCALHLRAYDRRGKAPLVWGWTTADAPAP
jgi:hypothetical protein